MGSEEQVLELMMLLDEGLLEATKLEEKLDEYDHKLQVCLCTSSRLPRKNIKLEKHKESNV